MSDARSDFSSRLETLGASVAHQERMLGELKEVLTLQWRKIDGLERLVANCVRSCRTSRSRATRVSRRRLIIEEFGPRVERRWSGYLRR